ncbi:MAG: hypothetical protein PHH40_03065 [Candidatus Moranbacteria bacterium]|nr:hypothetical protein [Candidatus Moranbacteria bacterium]MDD3965132.1 hypothetical protein [Candidatus Moranbacteria bacterium]
MKKTTQKKQDIEQYRKRLQEISETKFGSLSDDDILHTLAERKEIMLMEEHEQERLTQEKQESEEKVLQAKREAEEKAKKEQQASEARIRHEKKKLIKQKIEALNESISPEKKDEDLLVLIQERRALEDEIASLDKQDSDEEGEEIPSGETSQEVPTEELISQAEPIITPSVPLKEEVVVPQKQEEKQEIKKEDIVDAFPPALAKKRDDEFGMESIQDTGIHKNSQFSRYLDQLNNNTGSLGEFLQQLPVDAKQNKAFMLKVAEIDPAYAMHYADPDTLKIDEDFNMRIASLDNPRNSGNALAEMLPNARTSKVLLVAVKRDYRNIKFIESQMSDYDEMMTIAKKSALQKIDDLKESADIDLLIPKILQQNRQFMTELKEHIKKNETQ